MLKKTNVGYTAEAKSGVEHCQFCIFFNADVCGNVRVSQDPSVPENSEGEKVVSPDGWCEEFEEKVQEEPMTPKFVKFIPFIKRDEAKREVWGVVTAEVPDKDGEVCDYAKSKPYYEDVIAEMSKATDGENFMPLRQMHSTDLPVAGKSIGYEFRDADREIFMGFKVTDDKAWQNVMDKVYTGFSHGGVKVGEQIPDPVFKGCERYVAKPAEVSLVDNPCLGVAHFTNISKTGEITLQKNRCEVVPEVTQLSKLLVEVAALRKAMGFAPTGELVKASKDAKTKRVAGEDLPASAFLIVGDPSKTDTWHLPVKFSTDAKSKRHVANALARINQVKVGEPERAAAARKLKTLAEKYGIDVAEEQKKLATISAYLRKGMRARVNRLARSAGDPGHALTFIDDELGKLAKGMYEVSCLAQHVGCLSNLFYNVLSEQEWEKDTDSPLPAMLETNVNDLLDTLVALVAEETREQREELARRL